MQRRRRAGGLIIWALFRKEKAFARVLSALACRTPHPSHPSLSEQTPQLIKSFDKFRRPRNFHSQKTVCGNQTSPFPSCCWGTNKLSEAKLHIRKQQIKCVWVLVQYLPIVSTVFTKMESSFGQIIVKIWPSFWQHLVQLCLRFGPVLDQF